MTINTLYKSGRFPHALLLLNPKDGDVAEVLVLHKCDKADTVFVKESMPDSVYKIKPLREVIASGNYRPQFSPTRVFVFRDFETMSEICQNALLKLIEEPHEFNKFVMTAKSKTAILTTVLSRVVTVSGDESDTSPDSGESREIAESVVSALVRGNEYAAAAAFSRIKSTDRQMLSDVLHGILAELRNVMAESGEPSKFVKAADVVGKYIKRVEYNPSIPMTASSCTAELSAVLWGSAPNPARF